MDTVDGIPALLDSDPASLMGQYSRDLRTVLRPVAGIITAGADQNLPSGATTQLTFPTPTTDVIGGVTAAGGVLTLPSSKPGLYQVTSYVRLLDGSGGTAQLRLYAPGTNIVGYLADSYLSGMGLTVGALIRVGSSDVGVSMAVYQNTGVTIRAASSFGSPRLSAVRVA